MNIKAKNCGDSSRKSFVIRCLDHEATLSSDRTKQQQNGKAIGSVDHMTYSGKNREAVSGCPRMKPELRIGDISLGESSKTSSGIRKSSQERAKGFDAMKIKNEKVSNSVSYVKHKSHARVRGDSSKKRVEDVEKELGSIYLGESSEKGSVLSPTSSQEGTLIGYSDDRKQKIKESKTKIRNFGSKGQSTNKKTVIVKRPLICGICMDKKGKEEMFKSSCSHSFCLACIGNHVTAKIKDNLIKVKCPNLACKVLLEPQICKSFVPKQVIDRWESAVCESSLGSKKIYCPFKDCSALLIDDELQTVTSAECPHCHRLFCAQCQVPWHSGLKCKSIDGKMMDKNFIDLATKEKWKKCPSCKFFVQRTQGCECITCRCGYKFCYICGYGWVHGHLCPTR